MTWVDWIIVIVVAFSVLGGMSQGFFRSACSLGGLILGLVLAAWNYPRVAELFQPMVHREYVADIIGFLLIAVLVMAVAGIVGSTLARTMYRMGLGCLDRLAGAVFGFLQGVLLVALCILVTVAFYPQAHWLLEAKLPRQFFGVCHLYTHMSPEQLAQRVQAGLKTLEEETPAWLHPHQGRS